MITVSPLEIEELIQWLSSISEKSGVGTTRLLYDSSWQKAQYSLKKLFEEEGMEVEFDAVGNLFATVKGSEEPESIIASGSHVDTVIDGGRLDGQLGILAAYLAVKKLVEKNGLPKKSLRIISIAEEEGSRFPYTYWGSNNIFGLAKREDVVDIEDREGINFVDAMHAAGFDFNNSPPQFNNMEAFIELHIEQGNTLEALDKKVGIVNAIVGQKRMTVQLEGVSNHAGTTLMQYRKDTVVCFARIVEEAVREAEEFGDPLVLTFGRMEVNPNVVNVVPGNLEFSVDMRHTDQNQLNEFEVILQEIIKKHTGLMGINFDIDVWMEEAPTLMDYRIGNILRDVCSEFKLDYISMHSGAGHDSQVFASYVPTAMLFVPSIRGISHNPDEHTDPNDIVQGIQALAEGLKRLAY